jgi:maltooligosyltrehalose trehalohydrolase
VLPEGGAYLRVWAPRARAVEVCLEGGPGTESSKPAVFKRAAEDNGYHAGRVASAAAGALYRYRLDGADPAYPDPASRFQPQGPHGPSQVIDPSKYLWSDREWRGVGTRRITPITTARPRSSSQR